MTGSVFARLAEIDLGQMPEEVLLQMSQRLAAELMRRKAVRDLGRRSVDAAWKRLRGSCDSGRSQSDLLIDSWNGLFVGGDTERRYYVYAHTRPSDDSIVVKTDESQFVGLTIEGTPFYIGKGTGGRAFDLKRNDGHGAELRSLRQAGVRPTEIVKIIADCLTEDEALCIESKLIYILGTRYEAGISGMLVNLDTPPVPECLRSLRASTAGIGDMMESAAREVTRVKAAKASRRNNAKKICP